MPSATREKFCFTMGTLPNNRPAPDADDDPRDRANQVDQGERVRAHGRRARHKRHERPDDGDEAPEDDRLAAVFLEERVRPLQVLLIEQPVEESRSIGRREHARADDAADRVVDGVAGERGQDQ